MSTTRLAIAEMACSLAGVLLGSAFLLWQRRDIFAGFRRAHQSQAAHRSQSAGGPDCNGRRAVTHNQTAPALVTIPRPVPEQSPSFTAPGTSDVGLTQVCLCGAVALHVPLLSVRSTCHVCARTWLKVGSRFYFVPATQLHQFTQESES